MERLKSFFNTSLFGGLLVVLPLMILVLVLKGLYEFIFEKLEPITVLLIETTNLNSFLAGLITIFFILGVCFITGLLIQTQLGHISYKFIEETFLKKIPGFRIIKETVAQLFGSQKALFLGVALVDIYGSGTLLTAFVTDRHENGDYTVFIPSSPAPTGGMIYHLKKEAVTEVDYPADLAMKTILSLGAGSHELFKKKK